jgi:hypothetical protein
MKEIRNKDGNDMEMQEIGRINIKDGMRKQMRGRRICWPEMRPNISFGKGLIK